tara:strand:- start:1695 stop:3896 length:2202 start_codon:yes stop_codon:yes gene_type:complete
MTLRSKYLDGTGSTDIIYDKLECEYNVEELDNQQLRFPFEGSGNIVKNYSQVGQDLFVLSVLNGKRNGKYLEIGSGRPYYGNNTWLLESEFGWTGVGIDAWKPYVERYNQKREQKSFYKDACLMDWNTFMKEQFPYDNVIDYLSIDIDPAAQTFDALKVLPLEKFQFRVITFEHDYYQDQKTRDLVRNWLQGFFRYELIVPDIATKHYGNDVVESFEDWYIHPELVSEENLHKIREWTNLEHHKNGLVDAKSYILGPSVPIPKTTSKTPKWAVTPFPTLEITTVIPKKGCVVDCVFCPQEILKKAYDDEMRYMSMEDFKRAIDKVPTDVRIIFSGFIEPFMNRHCADMMVYAHEKGHPIAVFTTAVGMNMADLEKIRHIPFDDGPNGGFTLHLPDEEELAKHNVSKRYLKVIQAIKDYNLDSFYLMCMGTLHHKVKEQGIWPEEHIHNPQMWSRAGNLRGEAQLKPELRQFIDTPTVFDVSAKARGLYKEGELTCGCIEDVYHNILLPNGDVSLCCMDYGLEEITGNLYEQSYEDAIPENNQSFNLCGGCENAIPIKDKLAGDRRTLGEIVDVGQSVMEEQRELYLEPTPKVVSEEPKVREVDFIANACSTKCYNIDGYHGSCCSIEDRDYIIGPVGNESQIRLLQEYPEKTWNDFFISYEEGKDLFPDKPTWQDERHFPAMRINTSTERNNCNQYDPIKKNCSVYQYRPQICNDYLCDWLSEELTNNTFIGE